MSKLYRPNIENNSLNNRGNNTNQINKKFCNFNGKFGTSFMNNNSLSIDKKLIFGQINASGAVKPIYSNSQNE